MGFQIARKKPSAMEKEDSRQTTPAIRIIYSNRNLMVLRFNPTIGNRMNGFRLACKRGNLPEVISRRLYWIIRRRSQRCQPLGCLDGGLHLWFQIKLIHDLLLKGSTQISKDTQLAQHDGPGCITVKGLHLSVLDMENITTRGLHYFPCGRDRTRGQVQRPLMGPV